MNILRSIGAVLFGMIVVTALSYGTDYLFGTQHLQYATTIVILGVILYRFIYDIVGCYLVARLAPNHPMGHAWFVGILGFVLGIVATIATMNANIGPAWYGFAVAIVSLPAAWLGGAWRLRQIDRSSKIA